MLVSNGGQLIRVPVSGIRIASRATKGVTIFSTSKDERVVSVERISEPEPEAVDEVLEEAAEADALEEIARESEADDESGNDEETGSSEE